MRKTSSGKKNLGVITLSWMNDLYRTYEINMSSAAKDLDSASILLPVAHSTQNAQIEITLKSNGEFSTANKVEKRNAITIIPVTEDSAARGNGNNPHPLEDKLEYIAGDYEQFTKTDNSEKFEKFLNNLTDWSESEFSSPEIKAIRTYISKRSVMKDLIDFKILEEENEELTDSKIEGIAQSQAFVRFSVLPDSMEQLEHGAEVYKNKRLFESYTNYYISRQDAVDLCYASGRVIPCSIKHPSKIRHSADKSKLISANDTSGFTYRGRFSESGQVASIGYETSQKAHNALRWLIGKQGFSIGELSVVVWEISGKDVIRIDCDTEEALFSDDTEETEAFTNEGYAKRVELASKGYRQNLDTKAEIVVLGLEAATTGRLSVSFYKKMQGSDFVERIIHWHKTCFWRHNYKNFAKYGDKPDYRFYEGAPSPRDIAIAAFGSRNEKLIKATIERILPSIIDKKTFPTDIMKAAFLRATNPSSFDKKYEFRKAVSVACALIRKVRFDKDEEEWDMALDRENRDRSYVFGRLLGAAHKLEQVALYYDDEKTRDTSAERYMQQFVKKPAKTWGIIERNLKPYKTKLRARSKTYYEKELQSIYDLLNEEEFMKQGQLSELFLLGYNCQLNSYIKVDTIENTNDSNEEGENE